jgi:cobalt/nickel transport protein
MKIKLLLGICIIILVFSGTVSAHYGMVIPSDSMVMQGDNKKISLTFSFSHPFEGIGMDLEKPKTVQVIKGNGKENLKSKLKEIKVMKHKAWKTQYNIKRPGIYQFVMEPEPYWEPAEDCFIIHYTKTVVTAFEDDEGWDNEVGLKTEIVPLSKPFGLYAGNLFQGIVKLNGKPVRYAEVEVEYYNENGKSHAPTPYMITQTIKADKNGVFSYAAPKAGWWGFAALNTADFKLKHNGQKKDVELGAVIWVKFHKWQGK